MARAKKTTTKTESAPAPVLCATALCGHPESEHRDPAPEIDERACLYPRANPQQHFCPCSDYTPPGA